MLDTIILQVHRLLGHDIYYICGPMTGLPEMNFPTFFKAEKWAKNKKMVVVNPARFEKKGKSYSYHLRKDLQRLLMCNQILALPGWENSKGAKIEVAIGKGLGMPTYSIEPKDDGFQIGNKID